MKFGLKGLTIGTCLAASLLLVNTAFGDITNVTRLGTSANCTPTVAGPLAEGSQAYCDRVTPDLYTYTNVPPGLVTEAADYVIVAVEDRTLTDYGLELTVDGSGLLFLFIEDGLDVTTNMPWVAADGFADSGQDLTLDKAASGFADVIMNIYVRSVDAGEVLLGPLTTGSQVEGGGSIYGVAFATFEADLAVAKSLVTDPADVFAGGQVTFEYTVDNIGPDNAVNVIVADNPAPLTWVSDTAPNGCAPGLVDGAYDCDLGDIAASGQVVFQIVFDIPADAANPSAVNLAQVVSDTLDPVPGNDTAVLQYAIAESADLTVTKTVAEPVVAGAQATFTITVENLGQYDAANVMVLDTLPAGMTHASNTASGGCVVTTVVECSVGAVANGATATFDLTVDVAADAVGSVDNVADVQADTADPDTTNNSFTLPVDIQDATDITGTFTTSITFTNGFDGSVTAMLTCNAGLPLTNSFDISEGSPVSFTMTELPYTTPGTMCEIAIDGVASGYTAMGSANGGTAAASCMFDTSNFAVDGMNTCDFAAEPMATMVEVNTTIDSDDPTIEDGFETVIACMNVSPDTGPTFIDVTVTDTSGSFMANWYADPVNGTDCTVTMTGDSSAVEGDSCTFSFATGDAEAGCDVTGTVFFEGIPTLSQYGMAIMVLLMLGVGFVGMRRFV